MGFSQEENSGRLWLEGEAVCYESKTYASWRLLVDEIRIIGEMTNQNGPLLDDYFICFAKDSSGWMEASFYAEGRDDFLKTLGARLETQLELHFAGSADFASRIIWPEHLVDQPMFDFTDKVPRGIWRRLVSHILPQNLQTLSKVALGELPTATNSATDGDEKSKRSHDDTVGDISYP